MQDINDDSKQKSEKQYAQLEVKCPNCNEDNSINLSSEIKCKNCEEPLTKWKYDQLKKPIIGTFSALLIGGIAGHHIDDYFEKNRYPVAVEYRILDNCISSYDRPLRKSYIADKTNVCVCAFSKTIKEYDYRDFKEKQDDFLILFEQKANECM